MRHTTCHSPVPTTMVISSPRTPPASSVSRIGGRITWFGTGCNNLNVLGSHSRAGDQCKVVTVGLLVLAWPFPIAVIILDGLRLGITVTTTLAALPVLPWYWLLACTMDWLRRKIPEN
ncbi:MAG: hypothetical protein AABY13_04420 [Nanoarchaeota archaeon]